MDTVTRKFQTLKLNQWNKIFKTFYNDSCTLLNFEQVQQWNKIFNTFYDDSCTLLNSEEPYEFMDKPKRKQYVEYDNEEDRRNALLESKRKYANKKWKCEIFGLEFDNSQVSKNK